MFASSRFVAIAASSSLAIFAIVLSVLPTSTTGQLDIMSLIPGDILEAVPLPCRDGEDAEFPIAVNCGVSRLLECRGLLGVLDEFQNIPSAENVTECIDIEEPFCAIASTCEPCLEEFDILIRCIVLNSDFIDTNVTELIDGCPLTC